MLSQDPRQIRRRAQRKKQRPSYLGQKQIAKTPESIYSKLSARVDRFRCDDCGWGADAPMLEDRVWLAIARKDEVLCVGCTEQRLGRRIVPADLRRCLMNGAALYFLERYYD